MEPRCLQKTNLSVLVTELQSLGILRYQLIVCELTQKLAKL